MALKPNPRYARHNVHKGSDKKTDVQKSNLIKHEFFYTEGEYNFGKLNLLKYNWFKIYPLNEEKSEVIASVRDNGKNEKTSELKEQDYNKTLIFESKAEKAMAVMYLDLQNHYHELDLVFRGSPEGTLEKTKSMFERELKCKWKPRKLNEEIPFSGLAEKLEEN